MAGPLEALVCPPYDVISPERQQVLAARSPYNAVHIELPIAGEHQPPEARYREAAARLVGWRNTGVLRKDPRPAAYVYEQRYTLPGLADHRVQRGLLARLELEPFGPDGGVLRHELTLSGPKEDRFALLKATGVNTSPVVAIYDSGVPRTSDLLDEVARADPIASVSDDDGTEHRLWSTEHDGSGTSIGAELLAGAEARPLTIADGHHRYETALRYREERGRQRACESDPPYDYLLCCVLDTFRQELTVLPTHRLVRDGPTGEELVARLERAFEVRRLAGPDELLMELGQSAGGRAGDPEADAPPRSALGLWSDGMAALLRPRAAWLASDRSGGSPVMRALGVAVLSRVLDEVFGIDAAAATQGGRLSYTKDSREALDSVDRGLAGSAFLLRPTPVEAVIQVAQAGEVMPQKSTYFHPKAITGLLFNPLEP